MSDIKRTLKYIDQAIEALKDARFHTKYDKWIKADVDATYAYRYIKKVFPNISSSDMHCHHQWNCCCCCQCHHHPKPPQHITSSKFFAKVSSGMRTGDELIIPAASFVDDSGNSVIAFPSNYEYMTLFVNGMVQQNGSFVVAPFAVVVKGGAHLDSDDPITIELVIQI